MTNRETDGLADRFSSDEQVDQAIKKAVRETLLRHGRLGHLVVIWREGKPVWVAPQEVQTP